MRSQGDGRKGSRPAGPEAGVGAHLPFSFFFSSVSGQVGSYQAELSRSFQTDLPTAKVPIMQHTRWKITIHQMSLVHSILMCV